MSDPAVPPEGVALVMAVFTTAPESLDAVERASRIASQTRAGLVVALVVPPATLESADPGLAPVAPAAAAGTPEAVVSAETAALLEVAGRYGQEPEVVQVIDAEAVVELADQRQVSLIVVGAHRAGVLERLFAGDPGGAVVRSAACDVLVVHSRDGQGRS